MKSVYQDTCAMWALSAFGDAVVLSQDERTFRFAEEAIELAQARGLSREQVMHLVDHVYNRPKGNQAQEVGGVMVTLAVLCYQADISMDDAGWLELHRAMINTPQIRLKQHTKPPHIRGAAYPSQEPEAPDHEA